MKAFSIIKGMVQMCSECGDVSAHMDGCEDFVFVILTADTDVSLSSKHDTDRAHVTLTSLTNNNILLFSCLSQYLSCARSSACDCSVISSVIVIVVAIVVVIAAVAIVVICSCQDQTMWLYALTQRVEAWRAAREDC